MLFSRSKVVRNFINARSQVLFISSLLVIPCALETRLDFALGVNGPIEAGFDEVLAVVLIDPVHVVGEDV